MKFEELNLAAAIVKAVREQGYETPTPIQAQSIPIVLEGKDLLGGAQTGTGKTAAFTLPMLHRLAMSRSAQNRFGGIGIRALVLTPTRELAAQVEEAVRSYGQYLQLTSTVIFGGVGMNPQITKMKKGVDILVATPGRLLDLMQQGMLDLDHVQILVLDEADRMLDMGFIDDLHAIITSLPKNRQTMFFSATMPAIVAQLARKILKNPKRVEVTKNSSTALNIDQKVIFCKREDKFQLLRKILKEEERELVMIFTKTKNSADKVKEYLLFHRIPATVFHGDKSQIDREKALHNFKVGSMKVMIATDIAARGIDVQGVSHVINFELPMEAESYIHRIGRTARAGHEGVAITFCDESEMPNLERIEKLINIKIPNEKYKGTPEQSGKWNQEGSIRVVKAPTPGKSQERSAYFDHSKRQRVVEEGKPKPVHPGFRNNKKKKKK